MDEVIEKFEELLGLLLSIKSFSKDCHYNFTSYADHLLADRIGKGLSGFSDDIQEKCFLGSEREAVPSKDILRLAETSTPEVLSIDDNWKALYSLVTEAIELIENQDQEQMNYGEKNLMGAISDDLLTKRGLIWKRLGQ